MARGAVVLSALLAAALFLLAHARTAPAAAPDVTLPGLPRQLPPPGFGWWSNWDQWHYLQAALAWAHGALAPDWHWYLPFYPLLGAAGAWLTPADPFLPVNLACLLAALLLFAALSARLLPGVPAARPLGAALFVLTLLPPAAMQAWVTPWSTTPQTVGIYAALLAGLRFLDRPSPARAFAVACAGTAVAGFRPADAAVIDAVALAVLLPALLWRRPGARAIASCAAASLAGAALPLALLALAYGAVFGLDASPYLRLSATIGFEWRLLPLRWVLLVVDPRPLLPDGRGLVAAFPWVASGICGMASALALGRQRMAHALVAGTAAAELATMLAYRDLHPTELWRFELYHYFTWLLPLSGLYSVLLLRAVLRPHAGRSRARAALGALAAALLFGWRVVPAELRPLATTAARIDLPDGPPRVGQAVLVPAEADWDAVDNEAGAFVQDGRRSRRLADAKAYPVRGGALVLPLRPLPAGPAAFLPAPDLHPDPASPALLVTLRLVPGLPCVIAPDRAACQSGLPPLPLLSADRPLDLAADPAAFAGGWSHAEPAGRWTDGPSATLHLRLAPAAIGPAGTVLTLLAHAYVPDALPPQPVRVAVNGHAVARWLVDGTPRPRMAFIPAGLIGRDGRLTLRLTPADPRRPIDHGGGPDGRLLGLFARRLAAAPATSPP